MHPTMIKTCPVAYAPRRWRTRTALMGLLLVAGSWVMAADTTEMVFDPASWRLVTDGVMGGVSKGRLVADESAGRDCMQLSGQVSTANNGGFIQAAADLPASAAARLGGYDGLRVTLRGNRETYNIHLRTADLWLPWQSYRASVTVTPDWQSFDLPFATFEPYKTRKTLRPDRLQRVGIVAIGRDFEADVCIGEVGFYRSAGAD